MLMTKETRVCLPLLPCYRRGSKPPGSIVCGENGAGRDIDVPVVISRSCLVLALALFPPLLLKGRQSGSRPHAASTTAHHLPPPLHLKLHSLYHNPSHASCDARQAAWSRQGSQSWRLVGLNHGIPFARQDGSREKSTCTLFFCPPYFLPFTSPSCMRDQQWKL